jgi:hypothetical protein
MKACTLKNSEENYDKARAQEKASMGFNDLNCVG